MRQGIIKAQFTIHQNEWNYRNINYFLS